MENHEEAIEIEVVYALPKRQFMRELRLPHGSTARRLWNVQELPIYIPTSIFHGISWEYLASWSNRTERCVPEIVWKSIVPCPVIRKKPVESEQDCSRDQTSSRLSEA